MDVNTRVETLQDVDVTLKIFKTYYREWRYRKFLMQIANTFDEQKYNEQKALQAYEVMNRYLSYLQADLAMLTDEEGEEKWKLSL